jgi:hypothetical protein
VGGAALTRRHQLSCYSPGVTRPTRRLATPSTTSVTPLWIYPNLSYLRHPLSLTSTCRRSERNDDWRPHGHPAPAGAEHGLSQRRGRIPDAVTGELAHRARNAEAPRALKGRLMPTLAKASTINRTRGAFHPRGRRLLSRDASEVPSQPWLPTAAQTASTPLLPVTTMTLTRSTASLAQPPAVELPNRQLRLGGCSALKSFCVCGSSLA